MKEFISNTHFTEVSQDTSQIYEFIILQMIGRVCFLWHSNNNCIPIIIYCIVFLGFQKFKDLLFFHYITFMFFYY